MSELVGHAREMSRCRLCFAAVRWVRTVNGRLTPEDLDGWTHWATCPGSAEVRAGRMLPVEGRQLAMPEVGG